MGIQGFFQWLNEYAGPKLYVNQKDIHSFDHLYIDMNHLIHRAATECKGSKNEDVLLSVLSKYVEEMIVRLRPTKTITIAIDGPAPLAKIPVQRSRRERTTEKHSLAIAISPGTPLMSKISWFFLELMADKLKNNANFAKIDVYVSGSDVAGEGELKIFQILQMNAEKSPSDSHVIVTSDADMTVIGICSGIKNIYIFGGIGHTTYVKINEVFIKFKAHSQLDDIDIREISRDFTFMALLNGNDYVMQTADLKVLLTQYMKVKRKFPHRKLYDGDTHTIDLAFLATLLEKIYGFSPKFRRDLRPALSNADVENYLKAMIWNMMMYIDHSCPDYQWQCTRTPIEPQSISAWIRAFKQTANPEAQDVKFHGKLAENYPVSPQKTAMYLTPFSVAHNVLSPLQIQILQKLPAGVKPSDKIEVVHEWLAHVDNTVKSSKIDFPDPFAFTELITRNPDFYSTHPKFTYFKNARGSSDVQIFHLTPDPVQKEEMLPKLRPTGDYQISLTGESQKKPTKAQKLTDSKRRMNDGDTEMAENADLMQIVNTVAPPHKSKKQKMAELVERHREKEREKREEIQKKAVESEEVAVEEEDSSYFAWMKTEGLHGKKKGNNKSKKKR